jgi:hypothetical protein
MTRATTLANALTTATPTPRDAAAVHEARMCVQQSHQQGEEDHQTQFLVVAVLKTGSSEVLRLPVRACSIDAREGALLCSGSSAFQRRWSATEGTTSCPRNGSERPNAAANQGLSGGPCRPGPWPRGGLSA